MDRPTDLRETGCGKTTHPKLPRGGQQSRNSGGAELPEDA